MTVMACAALVEAADPDRFAATMAAPPPARAHLWPLYAFNIEVSRAPYASPEPLVAEMRLQWWVDTVEAMAAGNSSARGDVADALAALLRETGLPPGLLSGMAEARRWQVWRAPFADRAAFDDFLDATSGNLMWAAALALGAPVAAEPVVRDFAWGAGLAQWLRAVPELEARGHTSLIDGSPAAIVALAQDGLACIARARRHRHLLPRAAIPALWPGWQARAVLKQAARTPERVAKGMPARTDAARATGLILRAATGYW